MNLLFISISILILLVVIIVAAKPIIAGIKAKSDLIKEKEEEYESNLEKLKDSLTLSRNVNRELKNDLDLL